MKSLITTMMSLALCSTIFTFAVVASESGDMTTMKVQFQLKNTDVVIALDDHETNRNLLTLLPRKLDWEDYASTEKISYLPRKLDIQGRPAGYKPARGDFAYYAPWGNIVIFCKDFSYSTGLIKLGHIESGLENACQTGEYSVVLQPAG